MRLALALLPDAEASRALVDYAASLVRGRTARVALGAGRVPHLTLLHVETDEDPAGLWAEARATIDADFSLDFLGLGLLRYDTPYHAPPAPPATMAWLLVPSTRALRDAESRALAIAESRGMRVTTENGDRFQPHFTLAIWEGDAAVTSGIEAPPVPASVAGRRGVRARLALGVTAENGVYTRSLFTA